MNILKHPEFDKIAGTYEDSLGLPRGLLRSVAIQESGGRNIAAFNGDGGMGVFQFTDKNVIRHYNVNPSDPWDSLRAAAEYLGDGVKKYGKVEAALADFHRGPKAAQRVAAGGSIGSGPIESKYIPSVMGRLSARQEQQLSESVAKGMDSSQQIAQLRQAGFSDWIDDARQKGASPEEIVSILAPEAVKQGSAAKEATDRAGFVGNAVASASDTVKSLGRGAKQIGAQLTGNDARTAELQQEEQASRMDLQRIARGETIGGMVGSAAPYLATALIPGVNTIGGAAAVGAATGALQPTVEGESRFGNAALGGALGGGAVGAVRGVGRFMQASDEALAAQRAAAPLDQRTIAAEVTGRAGNQAATVNSEWVASTKKLFDQKYNDLYKGVTTSFDDAAKTNLNGAIGASVPTEYRRALSNLLSQEGAVPVQDVQRLARTIGKDLANPNLSALRREKLSTINAQLNETVERALQQAGKADEFAQTQQQYQNFKAARNMVASSGDTGVITPEVLEGAIKRGRFRPMFEEGKAPFQDMLPAVRAQESSMPKAVQTAMQVGSVIPGAAVLTRTAAIIMNMVGKNPKARGAFISKLNPVEQAAVQKAATGTATAAEVKQAEVAVAKVKDTMSQLEAMDQQRSMLAQALAAHGGSQR